MRQEKDPNFKRKDQKRGAEQNKNQTQNPDQSNMQEMAKQNDRKGKRKKQGLGFEGGQESKRQKNEGEEESFTEKSPTNEM